MNNSSVDALARGKGASVPASSPADGLGNLLQNEGISVRSYLFFY